MLQSEEDIRLITLQIAEGFRNQYHIEWPRIRRLLVEVESSEHRQQLARTEPEVARLFEMHTTAEREERGRELAMSVAVARAVVFGWGLIYQTLHRP